MLKYADDYLDKLLEMFPTISRKDIKRCVDYGWRVFYWYNLCGCDVQVKSQKFKFWMHCGTLYTNSKKHFNHYKKKLCFKIRAMFHKKHRKWDGFFYTSISKDEYEQLKNGAKRLVLKKRYIFKLLDEAKIFYDKKKYFIKFVDNFTSFRVYREEITCENPELVLCRENFPTFDDIMISKVKYNI